MRRTMRWNLPTNSVRFVMWPRRSQRPRHPRAPSARHNTVRRAMLRYQSPLRSG